MGQVAKVREDGKLELRIKKKAYLAMEEDAEQIYQDLVKSGGCYPFTDKVSPEFIKERFGLTKNAFKRAIGRLLKEGRIEMDSSSIRNKH